MRTLIVATSSLLLSASLLVACGSSPCDDVASEVEACFSALDCTTKSDQADMMACETAKADFQASSGSGGKCNAVEEQLAKACLDGGTISADTNCACQLN